MVKVTSKEISALERQRGSWEFFLRNSSCSKHGNKTKQNLTFKIKISIKSLTEV